ncbi:MAG: hypothetical protein ABR569_03220 [Gaiellaceae bacterium]
MRDRDRVEAAPALDLGRRFIVEQRDALPEEVGLAVRDEQRSLADRELRLRADARQPAIVADPVAVIDAQLLKRRPALPLLRNVLACVLADRAALRWRAGLRKLRPARAADRQQD